MNPEKFILELSKHNFKLTDQQIEQFKIYFNYLIEVNEHVNLTRITEEDEVYLKHFYDSITPLFTFGDVFKDGATLCDVGAGAGFPSIPLKILQPELKITIVDSLAKRLTFLKNLITKLDLKDVELVHGRAEDVGQNKLYREKFDLVTARAVARMSVLSEYCLPLVKKMVTLLPSRDQKPKMNWMMVKKLLNCWAVSWLRKKNWLYLRAKKNEL